MLTGAAEEARAEVERGAAVGAARVSADGRAAVAAVAEEGSGERAAEGDGEDEERLKPRRSRFMVVYCIPALSERIFALRSRTCHCLRSRAEIVFLETR